MPSIRARVPQIDPELEQILALSLERNPARRSTAAAMGHALDEWCTAQNEFGSPERLQEHLAEIFPRSYSPSSRPEEPSSSFSGMKGLLRPARQRGLLARLFG